MKNYYILFAVVSIVVCSCKKDEQSKKEVGSSSQNLVFANTSLKEEIDGKLYRDLNKNGKLDIYEDSNQSIPYRVNDLLSQMNLDEKAGMMFIQGVPVNDDSSLEKKEGAKGPGARMNAAITDIDSLKMNHFNIWDIPDQPKKFAVWYNKLQQYSEGSRLGIPITIASDPRHHFSKNIFSVSARGFSQFCETLGLAAIGDVDFLSQFAEIVRKEYTAVGIREALHPQIDLATEPRWARISGTFGEDAELTAKMAKAYILGLQGKHLDENGVACMTKHFPGGGPQKDGLDPHFEFQEGQIYPGDNFDYHLIPFKAAFEAHTAAIMPYYGVPVSQTDEDVAMSYNKTIITTLLRKKFGYEGIVCTDWGLITDAQMG
ncbi:MAG: glycoside hydrolase family 3 N-terminal domain-containing protein, partial [Leeuwenhoekiella sp.]